MLDAAILATRMYLLVWRESHSNILDVDSIVTKPKLNHISLLSDWLLLLLLIRPSQIHYGNNSKQKQRFSRTHEIAFFKISSITSDWRIALIIAKMMDAVNSRKVCFSLAQYYRVYIEGSILQLSQACLYALNTYIVAGE